MRLSFIALLFVCAACPERAIPERGILLVWRKPADSPSDIRSIVDRRLAHLKVKAHLQEDNQTLSVRVPNGSDVERIKALINRPGALSFCAEDATFAGPWCRQKWPDGVQLEESGKTCALSSSSRETLEKALGETLVMLAWQKVDAQVTVYALLKSSCISPHIVGVEAQSLEKTNGYPSLMIEFDRTSAKDFEALTTKVVGERLLINFDEAVQSAPVVREPIAGGRAMLTFGKKDELEVLAAVLAGGSLPKLTLEKEGRYGPPSLLRE